MVVTRIANQPITFPDQIAAYGQGVANTSQSSIKTSIANVPVNFSNTQGTVQYTPSTGTPVVYTTV
jgi:hypothetical protein